MCQLFQKMLIALFHLMCSLFEQTVTLAAEALLDDRMRTAASHVLQHGGVLHIPEIH